MMRFLLRCPPYFGTMEADKGKQIMAKDKKQKQINLEEITALTKELFHAHYAGDLERWFDYLCPDSVYLGTGEPMLFGGSAIREHFKGFEGRAVDVVSEEYYPVPLGETAAQVCGRIAVRSRQNQLGAVNCFTIGWRLIGGQLKMVHQHNSYEYTQPDTEGERSILKMDMNTTWFVRNLLLEQPAGRRIAFPSGNQTVYINPYTILYAKSRDKRTELVCVDRVVSCNYIYRELKERLPEVFYPLRRGYLVNTLYIVALRRFEAELISGISIPIPALTYTQVKRDLQELIEKK